MREPNLIGPELIKYEPKEKDFHEHSIKNCTFKIGLNFFEYFYQNAHNYVPTTYLSPCEQI